MSQHIDRSVDLLVISRFFNTDSACVPPPRSSAPRKPQREPIGFLGMTDIEQLRIEGTAYGPDAAEAAIATAGKALQSLLAQPA